MALCNGRLGEISHKIVYCGCAGSGKTSNLQRIRERLSVNERSDLTHVSGGPGGYDLDILRLSRGRLRGVHSVLHLYGARLDPDTMQAQDSVFRKMDGVVFVADSAQDHLDCNVESFLALYDALRADVRETWRVPLVIQANKRDLDRVLTIPQLRDLFDHFRSEVIEACALDGTGVMETLDTIYQRVVSKSYDLYQRMSTSEAVKKSAVAVAASPACDPVDELATFDREGGARFHSFQTSMKSTTRARAAAPPQSDAQETDKLAELLRKIGWSED